MQKKHGPEFKIVGGASEKNKEETKQNLTNLLFKHRDNLNEEDQEEFKKCEYPKSEKELALINFANEEINKIFRMFKLSVYNTPQENLHLIPSDFFRKIEGNNMGCDASTYPMKQGVVFNAERFRANPVYFGTVAQHELLHLMSYFAVEMNNVLKKDGEDEERRSILRSGVSASASQKMRTEGKMHEHFRGLNEAIVSSEQKKSFPALLNLAVLKEEKEWLMSLDAKEIKNKIVEEQGISEDEIISVDKNGGYEKFPYLWQRKVLNYVISEIKDELHGEYKNEEEVFNEFLKAHFTGRLLELAKIVEWTFGANSFRILGDMNDEKESAVRTYETLRKLRLNILKQKDKKK